MLVPQKSSTKQLSVPSKNVVVNVLEGKTTYPSIMRISPVDAIPMMKKCIVRSSTNQFDYKRTWKQHKQNIKNNKFKKHYIIPIVKPCQTLTKTNGKINKLQKLNL